MNITIKQLMDIVSLSILAVNKESDPTLPAHMENFSGDKDKSLVTPVENEVLDILGDNPVTFEVAKALNQHIAAIRLGKELNSTKSDLIEFT
jgi:hypothetical protein